MKFSLVLAMTLCIALLLTGCDGGSTDAASSDGRPLVVATTTMIADLAHELGRDRVRVVGIMKVGEDPHKYDVRPRDAQTIAAADLILMNGLNLEATLARVVENNARKSVVRLAEAPGVVQLDSPDVIQSAGDPHAWMSVPNYKGYTQAACDALVALDPDGAGEYRARTEAYLQRLDALDTEIRALFQTIPPRQRVIVTSHDAFNYLARDYEIEVHGVIGISTEQQPRPQDIEALVRLIRQREVRALFIETSVSQTLNDIIRKIARETGAAIGGTLYSDSLGDPGQEAGTYIDMMHHNVRTMVEALR